MSGYGFSVSKPVQTLTGVNFRLISKDQQWLFSVSSQTLQDIAARNGKIIDIAMRFTTTESSASPVLLTSDFFG